MKTVKTFENFVNDEYNLSADVIKDIEKNGWKVISSHKHNKQIVVKIEQISDRNWDIKDFKKFSWCDSYSSVNNSHKLAKLKVNIQSK